MMAILMADNSSSNPAMITLFTTAKSFYGNTGARQRCAIKSWKEIRPELDIIMIGKESGATEAALEFGVRYQQSVKRAPNGLPRLDDVFDVAQRMSPHHVLCYTNADIIFLSGLVDTIKRVAHKFSGPFLAMGRRIDVLDDVCVQESENWREQTEELAKHGKLYSYCASDYFAFRKPLWKLPELAVGCPGWDNWMLWKAVQEQAPVVDMTACVRAVHPEHGYGADETMPRKIFWKSQARQWNKRLIRDGRILEFGLGNVCEADLLWRVEQDSIFCVSRSDYGRLYHDSKPQNQN